MNEEDLLKQICLSEKSNSCYDILIGGIPVYNFIRRDVRVDYLKDNGVNYVERQSVGRFLSKVASVAISLFHLVKLRFVKREVLYHTFRIENINGVWMDKFFDPIIELIGVEKSYLILETNKGRRHRNRAHKENIVYDDFLIFIAKVITDSFYKRYLESNNRFEFKKLDGIIYSLQPKADEKRINSYHKTIALSLLRVRFYKWILRKAHIKCVISASRSSFSSLLCAAKKNSVRVLELQHGIEYGETVTYSGYRDPLFTPDMFLTFGDFEPKQVYGIEESKMPTVGWALKDYLEGIEVKSDINPDDVLVLSQPFSTDYILKSTLQLAVSNPNRRFYLRNHPLEKLNPDQLRRINEQPNLIKQDLKDTFLIAIKPFKMILGDQSTAIYEALSYGKKVGILTMDNRPAKFLKDEDSECFWDIKDNDSFNEFVKGNITQKKTYSIYSSFNKNLFIELINNLNI